MQFYFIFINIFRIRLQLEQFDRILQNINIIFLELKQYSSDQIGSMYEGFRNIVFIEFISLLQFNFFLNVRILILGRRVFCFIFQLFFCVYVGFLKRYIYMFCERIQSRNSCYLIEKQERIQVDNVQKENLIVNKYENLQIME